MSYLCTSAAPVTITVDKPSCFDFQIPGKWSWPTETTKITVAYPKFAEWAKDVTNKDAQDWYNYPVSGKVITK